MNNEPNSGHLSLEASPSVPGWHSALHALDWPRFLEFAEKEARTEPGKRKIRSLSDPNHWASDIPMAQTLQQETHEISALLDRDALWGPLSDLGDPSEVFQSLNRGGVLDLQHLVLLRSWVFAIESWSQIPRDEVRGEGIKKALHQLADPFEPLRILGKILTPEGELSEQASPRLKQLYSEIRSLKREIGIVLDQVLKNLSQKGVLQETFSDVRDDRYVVPIRISAQSEVEGIIHEASASRQTVFIEPKEVAPLNNRLRQRQNELLQEIYAILEAASKALRPFSQELENSTAILAYWDTTQAKARMARHYGGKTLQISEERNFVLRSTAHPLLWWSLAPEQIVRNDVDFGDPVRTLLLTGPNTGGKTVLLKTLGLAGVCARTGFAFPAVERPSVPFFEAFYADLGDSQSIEQHLSSFSGHLLKFKQILEQVTDRSLVLIDELNTATDPEEGAALGRACLETIMSRGAMVITTTHDPHLKVLAVSDARILNASMAFDEKSRTPTYRMTLGVPGRSRAIETAERLGISPEVVALATSYLSTEHREFERLLSKLESDVQETARARKEAVHIRDEAERLKKEWTERTELSVNEMMDRTRNRLRRVLEQAQDEVRTTVQRLDQLKSRRELDLARGHLNETFTQAVSRVDSALREEAPEIAEVLEQRAKEQASAPVEPLRPGTAVRVPKWKSVGRILELSGKKAKVAMGTLQMTLSTEDIEPISEKDAQQIPALKPKPKAETKVQEIGAPAVPDSRIDLRGLRYDDALASLERYLDQAFRSGGLAEVTIIHGLGTGALREGTRKLLKELPYIKEFRDGGPGQGGTGATIVEFVRD